LKTIKAFTNLIDGPKPIPNKKEADEEDAWYFDLLRTKDTKQIVELIL
jgi:hypothetical protein